MDAPIHVDINCVLLSSVYNLGEWVSSGPLQVLTNSFQQHRHCLCHFRSWRTWSSALH